MVGVALVLVATVSACTTSASSEPVAVASPSGPAGAECGDTLRDMVASAQKEGAVTLIATPRDWANYGAVIDSFQDMYGVPAVLTNPEASSNDELEAARKPAGDPDRPDIIDLGSAFTLTAVEEELVVPYRTTTWPQIPATMKDPEGKWVGSYYGIITIATNTTVQPVVPQSWADLLNPRYAGQVRLPGDPRDSGIGFGAVVAASLANGGTMNDLRPGIEFFAKLNRAGNLRIVPEGPSSGAIDALVTGEAPIVIHWSYNLGVPGTDFGMPGSPIAISVPADGVYGAFYTQSIVVDAPHPCAARLWLEHITSLPGALGFLNGLAIPARLAALESYGLISDDLRTRMPSPSLLNSLVISDPSLLVAAKAQVDELWGPLVLGEE